MSSRTPITDLWLERSRFNGMLLGGVSYGIFLLLTIQASIALLRKIRTQATAGRFLLAYVSITFVLATIGFAANAKYTQTIWIDSRDTLGGPPVLILTELDYWINRLALACYYVMEWFMSALLLYRCFIIWDRNFFVVAFMAVLFLGSIAMSILVLVESRIKDFYDINVQVAYLSLVVGANVVYTLLVAGRLFATYMTVKESVGKEHANTYISIITMIVESAAMYSVLGVLFIVSFVTHSNLSNLIFLSISHVQGIAQLLIILRVAEGHAFTGEVATRGNLMTTTLEFNSSPVHSGAGDDPEMRTTILNMAVSSTSTLRKPPSTMASIFQQGAAKKVTDNF